MLSSTLEPQNNFPFFFTFRNGLLCDNLSKPGNRPVTACGFPGKPPKPFGKYPNLGRSPSKSANPRHQTLQSSRESTPISKRINTGRGELGLTFTPLSPVRSAYPRPVSALAMHRTDKLIQRPKNVPRRLNDSEDDLFYLTESDSEEESNRSHDVTADFLNFEFLPQPPKEPKPPNSLSNEFKIRRSRITLLINNNCGVKNVLTPPTKAQVTDLPRNVRDDGRQAHLLKRFRFPPSQLY